MKAIIPIIVIIYGISNTKYPLSMPVAMSWWVFVSATSISMSGHISEEACNILCNLFLGLCRISVPVLESSFNAFYRILTYVRFQCFIKDAENRRVANSSSRHLKSKFLQRFTHCFPSPSLSYFSLFFYNAYSYLLYAFDAFEKFFYTILSLFFFIANFGKAGKGAFCLDFVDFFS